MLGNKLTGKGVMTAGYGSEQFKKGKVFVRAGYVSSIKKDF